MSKKVLECQYCGTLITENDTTCPKCGANCSKIIKEYKEEQNRILEEREAKKNELEDLATNMVKENFKRMEKGMNTTSKIVPFFFAIPIIMFIIIAFSIFSQIKEEVGPKKRDSVVGEINETIKTDDYTITIDKYEEYEYYHGTFNDCNTKDGYQRIAFHIVLENKKEENVNSSTILKSIDLKAGDEKVKTSSLKADSTFCKTIQGKEEYTQIITNTSILPGDKLAGYVGYEVPKDEKTLKFIINDSKVIEIDNPAYSK